MRREANGDQAKPARGETLLVSVAIVLQELQVVAQPEVQRQARTHLPLVLRVEADVRIGLRDHGVAEGLREARVVVGPGRKLASDENV